MATVILLVALAAALALISLGGVYEFSVADPFLAAPGPIRGGTSRKRFWIPAHIAFELMLVAALVGARSAPAVRFWLPIALTSHAAMHIWSTFDFILKTLAFEKAESGTVTEDAARRGTRHGVLRVPLDLVTCGAMLAGVIAAGRLG